MPFKVISPSKYFILSFHLASPNMLAGLLGRGYSPYVPQENINLNKRELNSQGPYSLIEIFVVAILFIFLLFLKILFI